MPLNYTLADAKAAERFRSRLPEHVRNEVWVSDLAKTFASHRRWHSFNPFSLLWNGW